MKALLSFVLPVFLGLLSSLVTVSDTWTVENHAGYKYAFKSADESNKQEYLALIETGITAVKKFSGDPYRKEFEVFVHPDRKSLDEQWQKDWNMPDFKSECWMVASGVATKLDMISPKAWTKEACEHNYADVAKTQQLITHELFHVYHGQLNASPDFSDEKDMDWFIEGFATYASGQCDDGRLEDVKKSINENTTPTSLNNFWTGKMKYGLSGSMVMFIDKKFGRKTLLKLLPINKKEDLLTTLGTSEDQLITNWKAFMQGK